MWVLRLHSSMFNSFGLLFLFLCLSRQFQEIAICKQAKLTHLKAPNSSKLKQDKVSVSFPAVF